MAAIPDVSRHEPEGMRSSRPASQQPSGQAEGPGSTSANSRVLWCHSLPQGEELQRPSSPLQRPKGALKEGESRSEGRSPPSFGMAISQLSISWDHGAPPSPSHLALLPKEQPCHLRRGDNRSTWACGTADGGPHRDPESSITAHMPLSPGGLCPASILYTKQFAARSSREKV